MTKELVNWRIEPKKSMPKNSLGKQKDKKKKKRLKHKKLEKEKVNEYLISTPEVIWKRRGQSNI